MKNLDVVYCLSRRKLKVTDVQEQVHLALTDMLGVSRNWQIEIAGGYFSDIQKTTSIEVIYHDFAGTILVHVGNDTNLPFEIDGKTYAGTDYMFCSNESMRDRLGYFLLACTALALSRMNLGFIMDSELFWSPSEVITSEEFLTKNNLKDFDVSNLTPVEIGDLFTSNLRRRRFSKLNL